MLLNWGVSPSRLLMSQPFSHIDTQAIVRIVVDYMSRGPFFIEFCLP